jgi:hypothetical protein
MGARNQVGIGLSYQPARARICKRLRGPGIDFQESISPAYVAWRAGTKNRVVVPDRQAGNRFLVSLTGLQIRAQATKAGGIHSLESIPGLPLLFRQQGVSLSQSPCVSLVELIKGRWERRGWRSQIMRWRESQVLY